MGLLKDKVAVITGGGRGIGREIARACAAEGSHVVIFDKVFPDDFEVFADELRATGVKVLSRQVDITSFASTEQAMDEIAAECGTIDILVNNAGITRDKLLMRMSEEDWDLVLMVNLKGAFNTVKAATKHMMRQRSGKIVNISSVVGIMGNAGQANYSASKSGLHGFTKSIAKELAGRNITANCVAPGFVETEMTAALSEEVRAAYMSVIPMKRLSKPEEVAKVVVFLASENSNYITGQVLAVDGGMTM